MKNTSMKALLLSAAMTGLLAGANAATVPVKANNNATSCKASKSAATLLLAQNNTDDTDKQACKGKNDCKGQGVVVKTKAECLAAGGTLTEPK